jgi:agmatine deiminase
MSSGHLNTIPARRALLRAAAAMAWLPLGACRQGPQADAPAGEPVPEQAPPPPAGWRLAADFDPAAAIWISFDAGHQALSLGLVAALQPHVAVKALVPNAESAEALQTLLRQRGLAPVTSIVDPQISFYLRDMAVLARTPTGLGVIDFQWSEYGTAAWCSQRHGPGSAAALHCAGQADLSRATLDATLARHLGAALHRSPLAIEGGGFETNGQGLVIANEALYLSRNPGRPLALLESWLLRLPGVRKVIWLPDGLAEDPLGRASITAEHVAWGTGGHTDEFVRFADASTVLLAWPEDADVAAHPVARVTRQRMQRNLQVLAGATDADGKPLRVLKVPMPRLLERRVFLSAIASNPRSKEWSAEHFPPSEGRWQGQPVLQVATASYMNFVVANGVVVLPDYLPHGTPRAQQERVRRVVELAFPGRRTVFVDAISANWVGGGLHCATLNEPRVG